MESDLLNAASSLGLFGCHPRSDAGPKRKPRLLARVAGVTLAVALLASAAACSSTTTQPLDSTATPSSSSGAPPGAPPRSCPLTADNVSSTLGKPVRQQGADCVFTSDVGTVRLVIEEHPADGQAAYDVARRRATGEFAQVEDVRRERTEFVALAATEGQATALANAKIYVVSVQRFGFSADAYRTVALQLLDAVLG